MDDKELEKLAQEAEASEEFSRRLRTVEDFRYDEIQEKFWDITTGTLLGAKSVDGAISMDYWPTKTNAKGNLVPMRPSLAINNIVTGLTVEGSTWWPGKDQFIENHVVNDRGAMKKRGAITYNTYVGPDEYHAQILKNKKLPKPTKWINHVKKLWPIETEHEAFFNFAAHMVQRPDQKVNHGLVIAGAQGIGKDTAMHPLRFGVGEWNAAEVDPDVVAGQYNPHLKSVLLVINEVRPHDEDHKSSNFYNQLKPLLASPPDMLAMNIKYANTIYVRNLAHVILTTNEPLTMFIPAEDRRLCVLVSALRDPKKYKVFHKDYFNNLWKYLHSGGTEGVIKWLLERDISDFEPNSPPPMTEGKQAIINSASQIRRTIVDDLIENYIEFWNEKNGNEENPKKNEGMMSNFDFNKKPDVIFGKDLLDFLTEGKFFDDIVLLKKMLSAKNFHFKMDEHGYNMVRNPFAPQWKFRKYRSRAAFVSKEVPQDGRYNVINEALQNRPLEFGF